MTEQQDYIAYLETSLEVKANRIAELEAALIMAINNIESAMFIQEINGVQIARAREVMAKSRPISNLTTKHIKAYYAEEAQI